ncbi:restriction endonuclease subunit S [Mesorhizobium sp. M0621]|uniref:restriction endonuclease subunit S n=1 Tax=Mesorhizobium sp. M0621 TaxID=2956974 RepID=UPI0033376866
MHVVRLDEVCEINPRMPKTVSDDDTVSFLPMAAVSEDGQIDFEEERPVREVRKGYTYFERDDVLMAKITPCFENGKATRTSSLANRLGFGSTEFHVLRAGPEVDPAYLFYLIWNAKFRELGANNMTGSAGQKRVPADFLKRLEIPLPPLSEQRRIAAILDKADALRRKRKRAVELLDSLTQSIFLEMFGEEPEQLSRWGEPVPLSEVANIGSGITKGRKLNGSSTRQVPYLAVVNVQDRRLDLSTVKFIEATNAEIARYRLELNDLLLTEGGDPDKLGRGTLWTGDLDEAIHQNHVFRVRIISNCILPLFLSWLVGSSYGKKYFLSVAKQTTGIASINKTQLSAFPTIIPPLELQQEFVYAAERITGEARRFALAMDRVDSLFSSLQHRAFSGQL